MSKGPPLEALGATLSLYFQVWFHNIYYREVLRSKLVMDEIKVEGS